MRSNRLPAILVTAVLLGTLATTPGRADVVDFEGDAPGTVLSTVLSAAGDGPFLVRGLNPECGPDVNAAVVFDSTSPTGLDFDLGTPNRSCPPLGVGQGQGAGGELGAPDENCDPLGNLLIVHEFCPDLAAGGPVADPDDASFVNGELYFDFSRRAPVEAVSLTLLDFEMPGSFVELHDRDGALLARIEVPPAGNNGKRVLGLGPTPGVHSLRVSINGPGAVDDLVFRVEGEAQGCSHGYWKQPHHEGAWQELVPEDLFDEVFGVDAPADDSLLEALGSRGGQENALQRHAVAALLNAVHDDVAFAFTRAQVVDFVQQAYATGNYNEIKDLFEEANEAGCPLGRPYGPEDRRRAAADARFGRPRPPF